MVATTHPDLAAISGSSANADADFHFRFGDRVIAACDGDSIAVALTRAGIVAFGEDKTGARRGLYCGMGVCHDCLVQIEGEAPQRACMTRAKPGQVVLPHSARQPIADGTCFPPVTGADLPLETVDILIIGAGPAGLAAAEVAARAGCGVMVVDERAYPGGQFYKQPVTAAKVVAGQDQQGLDGAALIARVHAAGASFRTGTLVWGGSRDDDSTLRLALHSPEGASYVRAKVLIIATGAYEQPPLFEGWTLPGVMTTGAAQTLLRSYGVVPGHRIVVAGNGPLNLQVGLELARAGATVAAIVESAAPPWARPHPTARMVLAAPGLAFAGLRQLAELKRRGVPVLWRHKLVAATGAARVEQAVVSDPNGRRTHIAVDALCVNEGFTPSSELARLFGCIHDVRMRAFSWLEVQRDENGRTSQPDIFVVGEAGGFGGAHIAMAQGRLAGAAAAASLGHVPVDTIDDRRKLASAQRFQAALWQTFAPDPQQAAPFAGDEIVCRCESISLSSIMAAEQQIGRPDAPTIKRLTRAGMGRCQGRYCMPRIASLMGREARESDFPAPQMPLRPIPLAAISVEKPEWGGHKRALLPPASGPFVHEPLGIKHCDVAIIGAGVVGAATALFLARGGRKVAVLERGMPNGRASGGNAGSLHAQLLSFDHGAKSEGGGSLAAQTLPLQRDSIDLWRALEQELGIDLEIKVTGGLMVAESEQHLRFLDEKCRVERKFGIDCSVITAADLRALEPALDPRFVGAAYCPQEGKINPLVATQGLVDAARAAGAQFFERTNVRAITRTDAGFSVETAHGTLQAGKIVNAAGAFASEIGTMLGLAVPVFGAPLQMIVTEAAEPTISRLIAHADRHLTLKQAANGNFLIGGGWTAGLDPVHHHPRPLFSSLEGNAWVAQHVVPALRGLNIIRSWAAMNINIDGAPILGEAPGNPGFFNAVTSNGYTLGPLVGRITAELILNGRSKHDISAFTLARFENRRKGDAA